MNSLGKGIAIVGICALVAFEIFEHTQGWVIGWTIAALFYGLVQLTD